MFFVSFYRVVRFAFQNFFRNFWLSLVTVTIIILALFSFTVLIGMNAITDAAITSVEEKVDIALYLKPEVSQEEALLIGQKITEWSQVSTVDYVSPEDALAAFTLSHKDDPLILESLKELEENPLGSSLVVRAHDIEQYDEILAALKRSEISSLLQQQDFQDNEALISKLRSIGKSVSDVGIIISLIFVLIAVLVVFNTIRIGTYTRREEIGIMRLVGASNWFIRMPFVAEGFLYALFGIGIFWIIFFLLLQTISPYVGVLFAGIDFDLLQYFSSNGLRIALWEFTGIVVLNFISVSFALSRYLDI